MVKGKAMYIIYRDELGTVIEYITGNVSILEGKAYYTTEDETDKILNVDQIVEIGMA